EALDRVTSPTAMSERPMPSTAAYSQQRLGMHCAAFDLNAACAGFVYALSVGVAQIVAGAADHVLVVGAETLSRTLDMTDRTTCVLFGDGAGAVLLERSDEPGVVDSTLELDGKATELLTIYAGGSEEPASEETVRNGRHALRMTDGRAVFKRAATGMAEACAHLLEKTGMTADDVSLVIPHQANARIMLAVVNRLN